MSELCPVRFVTSFCSRMATDYHCTMHRHPHIEIIYHATGNGRTRTERGQEWAFRPGTVVVHEARELHEQWSVVGGADHCLQVVIADRAVLPGFDSFSIWDLQDRHARRELADLQSWGPATDAASQRILDLRVSSVLLALWREHHEDRGARAANPAAIWVRQARRLVYQQLDSLRTVTELAAALGISADHLRHVCREELGQSPKQLILDARIERAQDLLRYSPSTLDEVAELSGFANARQFCTTFRHRTGQTPGAYRQESLAG